MWCQNGPLGTFYQGEKKVNEHFYDSTTVNDSSVSNFTDLHFLSHFLFMPNYVIINSIPCSYGNRRFYQAVNDKIFQHAEFTRSPNSFNSLCQTQYEADNITDG